MGFKITDHSGAFKAKLAIALDKGMGHLALDILNLSRMQVPHKTGRLTNSSVITRKSPTNFHIEYNTEYAGAVHNINKNYRNNRKWHYLIDPANSLVRDKEKYIKQAVGSI